jgi:hypothetical protein
MKPLLIILALLLWGCYQDKTGIVLEKDAYWVDGWSRKPLPKGEAEYFYSIYGHGEWDYFIASDTLYQIGDSLNKYSKNK